MCLRLCVVFVLMYGWLLVFVSKSGVIGLVSMVLSECRIVVCSLV